jgi:hypothetical protein
LDNLWIIKKLCGPTISRPVRTTGRPCLDRADCPQTVATATSPPTISAASFTASGGYKGRPPPPSSVERPLPPPSPSPPLRCLARRRVQPPLAPIRPPRPHPEHRAVVYDLPAPRDAYHHSRMSPPPQFLSDRPHLTELVLPMSFFLPAAPKLVHHRTALLLGRSPLHLIAGTGGIRPGRRRPVPWERAPLPLDLGPKGQVGRELLARLA